MSWDKNGRYYTRSRRVNGRVVREYVGGGMVGQLAAQLDSTERDKRQADRGAATVERDQINALDATPNDFNDLVDLLARAALVAAGFHQHNRGNWRKRRGDRTEAD